jgi:hypothetical protein
MAQETIKFIIKQDGTVTEEVMGVVGPNCEKLTERIEEKLGALNYREVKSEYYDQKQTTEDHVTLHMHQD